MPLTHHHQPAALPAAAAAAAVARAPLPFHSSTLPFLFLSLVVWLVS
jgi:hypothetical protein